MVEATSFSQSRDGPAGLARGQDLDEIAGAEPVGQRDDASVDLCAHAAVADVGVDVVGEVDRRRPGREVAQLALGGEDEHLVAVQVAAQRLEELRRIGGVLLPVHHPVEPGELAAGVRAAALVQPVRRHAEFGGAVHVVGADLDLERSPSGPTTVVCSDWYMFGFGTAM